MANVSETATTLTAAPAAVAKPPIKLFRNMTAKMAMTPMMATVIFVFIGCTAWTIFYSLTVSRVLPASDPLGKDFVGLEQYVRLFASNRWQISIRHLAIYGALALI